MKQTLTGVLTLLALAMAPVCAIAVQPDFVQGEILVQFKPGASAQTQASVHAANKANVLQSIRGLDVDRVTAPKGCEIAQCNRYKGNKAVEYAEPNYLAQVMDTVPSDPLFASDQWDMTKIQAPAAWDITTGSDQVIVAVVDTGVDYNHPDLASRMLPGYDFYSNDSNPMDEYGHGTMAAGVVGACSNNATGVAGVTWTCKLLPLKTADATGSSPYSCITSAITYAADHGARVATVSLGGNASSITLQNAVTYAYQKGCLVVAAAGNQYAATVVYPAACDNAIAVGATDSSDAWYSYSNYGSTLDISAPGYAYTTALGGGYGAFGGTSAATPHVAGVAALLFSVNPSLTPDQVTAMLEQSADDINTPGWDQYTGFGRVNAFAALNTTPPAPDTVADTTPPSAAITSPAAGSSVLGTTTVTASASDNTGVTCLDYYCDGALIASTAGSPSLAWNTTTVPDGAHKLTAVARDAAGNSTTSAAVGVTVANAYFYTQTFTGQTSAKSTKSQTFTTARQAAITASLSWAGSGTLQLLAYDRSGKLLASVSSSASPINVSLGTCSAGSYRLDVRANVNKLKYTLVASAKSN